MLRLAADENFNGRIVRGLRRRVSDLDLVRVQDTPVRHAEDPALLEWTIAENRVLLTHDLSTIPAFAYHLLESGSEIPGILAIRADVPIGLAIEEIALVIQTMSEEELANLILFLPL